MLCLGVEDFAVGIFFHAPAARGVGGAEGAVILVVGERLPVQGTAAGQVVVDGFKRIVTDKAAVGNLLPDAVKELLLVVGREVRPA